MRTVFADQPAAVSVVLWSGPDGTGGMTVTSVNAASLDPPLLVFCVDRRSSRLAALRRTPEISVNLLGAGQGDVADRYARRGDPGRWDASTVAGGAGRPHVPGARWSLLGRVVAVHDVGASDLFVVQVSEVLEGPSSDPLVHHQRAYGSVTGISGTSSRSTSAGRPSPR
nr:flavin reductase family protein [Isoptericola halotolerans]